MDLPIGGNFERYTIEAQIGQGGMGQVYRAFDPKLHRRVALKVLRAGPHDDDSTWGEAVARMLREARAAAALDHPNVVAVFDLGEFEGTPFIAMELVAGIPLRQTIGDSKITLLQKLRWLADVARALSAAHEAGIIHRDIKPENILVRKDGVIKVLDFGIARRVRTGFDAIADTLPGGVGTITLKGAIVGTPAYMAPEQVLGEEVDARTDQFAWGVLAYELLSGSLPWERPQPAAIMAAILHQHPAPLDTRCEGLPDGVASMVARALSKPAEGRYPSMDELVLQLDELVAVASVRSPRAALAASLPPPPTTRSGDVASAATPPPAMPPSGVPSVQPTSTTGSATTTAPAALAPPKRSRTRWIALGALAIGLIGLSWPASRLLRRSVLAAPGSVLACPPLVGKVGHDDAPWLGAAAAGLACNRAAILLGGRTTRTLVPAELLDAPHAPGDQFPRDLFSESGARDRAIAAAKTRASAWLDGEVTQDHGKFSVTLVMRRPDGTELARGSSQQLAFYQAMRDAMAPMVASGTLPASLQLDPELAPWIASHDVAALLAGYDLSKEGGVLTSIVSECSRAAPFRDRMGADWAGAGPICTRVGHAPIQAPPIDRSSASAFVRTAAWFPVMDPKVDLRALAEEAGRLREQEATPTGRRMIARLEASLWYAAGNNTRARELALAQLQESPADPEMWNTLQIASYREPGFLAGTRAYSTWVPDEAEAWNSWGYADSFRSDVDQIAIVRRALVLSSDHPAYAISVAGLLIDNARHDDVRVMASRLVLEGPTRKIALDVIEGLVETSEGRLGAALDRWLQTAGLIDELGNLDRGDHSLVRAILEVALIVGRSEPVARELYKRFIEPEPPKLYPWHPFSAETAAFVCLSLPHDQGHACMDRLDALVTRGWFRSGLASGSAEFYRAAVRYFDGDMRGALVALRVGDPGARVSFVAQLLDAAGAPEEAQRVDDRLSGWAPRFHGATSATIRSARRAAARGDTAAARRYCALVIAAWSRADVDVPAVDQMRELLRSLDKKDR